MSPKTCIDSEFLSVLVTEANESLLNWQICKQGVAREMGEKSGKINFSTVWQDYTYLYFPAATRRHHWFTVRMRTGHLGHCRPDSFMFPGLSRTAGTALLGPPGMRLVVFLMSSRSSFYLTSLLFSFFLPSCLLFTSPLYLILVLYYVLFSFRTAPGINGWGQGGYSRNFVWTVGRGWLSSIS